MHPKALQKNNAANIHLLFNSDRVLQGVSENNKQKIPVSDEQIAIRVKKMFEDREYHKEFKKQPLHLHTSEDAQYLFFLLRRECPDFDRRQQILGIFDTMFPGILSNIYRGNSAPLDSDAKALLEEKDVLYLSSRKNI